MSDRKLKKENGSKPKRSQEARTQAVETENRPSHEHNSLTRLSARIGDSSSARKHASILRRTMASQPSLAHDALLQLQRQYGNCYVQRVLELAKKGEGEMEVAPDIEKTIQSKRGGGQALDKNVRTQMESAFGSDFSGVRAHTDGDADTLSRQLNARAFTTGKDIFFKQGEYSPGSSSGRKLLAHELTHVVQQNGDNIQHKFSLGRTEDEYEQEADQIADRVMQLNVKKYRVTNGVDLKNPPHMPQVQRDVIAGVGLGLAIFMTGRELFTGGAFSCKSNAPSYMHEKTPAEAKWDKVITTLHIKAAHPRIGFGWQDFYFRLSYEYNGYDIRSATINPLVDKSSGMVGSTFEIEWAGAAYSRPTEPVSQIIFNINGRWDPYGRGDVSFWGELVLSAGKEEWPFNKFTIDSEKQWVIALGIT